ncbi:MAG: ribosome small subunit-dependent GTPase A [Lentisphaeria bacterium]|nr:ribosome small subunit-dependent GTPase A [Lentisphaeria bacterium]
MRELGWNSFFEKHYAEYKGTFIPARVTRHLKHHYQVFCEEGELTAKISGNLRHRAKHKGMFPAVGDWVVIKARPEEGSARIHAILPRQTKLSRKVVLSATDEQVVAANITTVFLMTSVSGDKEFSLRRLERYLTLSRESGAAPVILLNKIDLCENIAHYLDLVTSVAPDIPIHAISATEETGTKKLERYLGTGSTVALLGSSGVGKSALTNALAGDEVAPTGEVRESDGAGRHTTTHRELYWLKDGGALIDTPGMRELQMWAGERSLLESFSDIVELGERCRFVNCQHLSEPDCAVKTAIDSGSLDEARYLNFLKIREEHEALVKKREQVAKTQQKIDNPKRQTWRQKKNSKKRQR